MFNKILIANRGEIACRVIKTARRMGIRTVAVYSEADANARHVRLADEAVLLGPAAARESYLVADKIIDACLRTGAQAEYQLLGTLAAVAGYEYRHLDYDAEYAAFLDERRDRGHELLLGLRQQLGERLRVELTNVHTWSFSNLPLYEYRRNVTSLSLALSF